MPPGSASRLTPGAQFEPRAVDHAVLVVVAQVVLGVLLEVRRESRPLAGKALADVFEVVQPGVRSEGGVVVEQRVAGQHADGDHQRRHHADRAPAG